MMQDTRQRILEYLNTYGEASVEELRDWLDGITAVTVRHHLDVLRRDGLVASPMAQRRDTPGRPKYIYTLTNEASEFFPKNYHDMTDLLLEELEVHMEPQQVNVIFEGVGRRMAAEALPRYKSKTLEERLRVAVEYLTEHGYAAQIEPVDDGFLLHTSNCPYDRVQGATEHLCIMDASLIGDLIGIPPQRRDFIMDGDRRCSYYFPAH